MLEHGAVQLAIGSMCLCILIRVEHVIRGLNLLLVGGLEHVFFFHLLGISSSQLKKSYFFRGVGIPPTSIDSSFFLS